MALGALIAVLWGGVACGDSGEQENERRLALLLADPVVTADAVGTDSLGQRESASAPFFGGTGPTVDRPFSFAGPPDELARFYALVAADAGWHLRVVCRGDGFSIYGTKDFEGFTGDLTVGVEDGGAGSLVLRAPPSDDAGGTEATRRDDVDIATTCLGAS